MSEFRLGGAEQLRVLERVGDPAAAANQVQVYAKDVAAVTNLFARLSDGTVFVIAGPGVADTLNEAYNGPGGAGSGRAIDANANAVTISSVAADNNNVLELSKVPVGAQSGSPLTVTTGANLTGDAIAIVHAGSADAINVVLATSTTAQAFVVTEDAVARTTSMVSLTRDAAVTSGLAHALNIANAGTANAAINLDQSGGGIGLIVSLTSSITARGIFVLEDAVARTLPMMILTRDAAVVSGVAHVVELNNNGDGNALDVNVFSTSGGDGVNIAQGGAGDAVLVSLTGVAGNRAIVVSEDAVARTNPMVLLIRNAAVVSASAHVVAITNAATLNNAIDIDQSGGGDAINVALATSTTAQALVVTEDAVARTLPMVQLGRNAAVVAAAAHVIDINNFGTTNNAIDVNQLGGGNAFNVVLNDAILTGQAFVVTESAMARTTSMVQLTRDVAVVSAVAHVVAIVNAATLNNAIDIDQSGGGDAINVALATSTTAQAFVVTEDAVARTTPMVSLTRDVAVTSAVAHAIDIFNSGTTNSSIRIDQAGGGDAITVVLSTSTTAQALVVAEDAVARTTEMIQLTRILTVTSAAAHVIGINNGGTTNNAIDIDQSGGGDAVNVALATSTTGQALVVTETAVARTTSMVQLTRDAAVTSVAAHVIDINNDATQNAAIRILQGGGGDAINIALDFDILAQGLVIAESVASTTPMVALTRSTTGAFGDVISISKVPGGATAGEAIDINMGANTTGQGIAIAQNGTGSGIDIDQIGAGDAINISLQTSLVNQAIVVTETAVARTTSMVSLTRDVTVVSAVAHVIAVVNAATLNNAIDIDQSGGGDAINVALATSMTAQALVVTEDAVARTTPMIFLARDATSVATAANVIEIDNNGTANHGIRIDQGGGGDAILIALDTNVNGQAITVTESAIARGLPMIQLTRDAAAVATAANVIEINNDGGANHGVRVLQGGGGHAIDITLDSNVNAQALVVTETAAARTMPMMSLVRDAAASGTVVEITNAGSGLSLHIVSGDAQFDGDIGFYGTAPVAQTVYTLNAVAAPDRTLLASVSATILNNNNVLAAIITDLQANGLFG